MKGITKKDFIQWIRGYIGNAGNFSYKPIHLWTSFIVMMVLLINSLVFRSKKVSDKTKRVIIIIMSVGQLILEIVWRVLFYKYTPSEYYPLWPIFPCNLNVIIVPIIAILNWRIGKSLFYMFAFFGGVVIFFAPYQIFIRDFPTFPLLKDVIQHYTIIAIPSYEYAANIYRPAILDMVWFLIGFLIHLFHSKVINPLVGYNKDTLFLESGLPFRIPGCPDWIITVTTGVILFTAMNYFSDIKTSNDQLKRGWRFFKSLFSRCRGQTTDYDIIL